MVEAVGGQLARVARKILATRIGPRSLGRVTIAELAGKDEIPVIPHRQPDRRSQGQRIAVMAHPVVLRFIEAQYVVGPVGAPRYCDHRVARRIGLDAQHVLHPGHAGAILAVGDRSAHALAPGQLDIDDARDRVRPIKRGGPVAQDFDPVDGDGDDLVQIDRARSAAHRSVEIEQRRLMPTLAINQHQRLVRRQPAQRGRAKRVGTVGQRRLGEVERWHELVQQAAGFGIARMGQLLAADDVDRHRAVGDGPPGNPAAGHDDHVLRLACRFLGRALCGHGDLRGDRKGQAQPRHGGEQ